MVNLSYTPHGTGDPMNVGLNGLFEGFFLQLTGQVTLIIPYRYLECSTTFTTNIHAVPAIQSFYLLLV